MPYYWTNGPVKSTFHGGFKSNSIIYKRSYINRRFRRHNNQNKNPKYLLEQKVLLTLFPLILLHPHDRFIRSLRSSIFFIWLQKLITDKKAFYYFWRPPMLQIKEKVGWLLCATEIIVLSKCFIEKSTFDVCLCSLSNTASCCSFHCVYLSLHG